MTADLDAVARECDRLRAVNADLRRRAEEAELNRDVTVARLQDEVACVTRELDALRLKVDVTSKVASAALGVMEPTGTWLDGGPATVAGSMPQAAYELLTRALGDSQWQTWRRYHQWTRVAVVKYERMLHDLRQTESLLALAMHMGRELTWLLAPDLRRFPRRWQTAVRAAEERGAAWMREAAIEEVRDAMYPRNAVEALSPADVCTARRASDG